MSNIPPWRADILKALHKNRSAADARYVHFASQQLNGYPAVRTVVFRGFVDDTGVLVFHTDQRSDKVAQLRHCDQVEVSWYFRQTRQQFRLTGKCSIVDTAEQAGSWQSQLRNQHWQQLSAGAKATYAGAQPGSDITTSAAPSPTGDDEGESMNPRFTLLLLTVTAVDQLDLRPSPHQRVQHLVEQGRWVSREIHP